MQHCVSSATGSLRLNVGSFAPPSPHDWVPHTQQYVVECGTSAELRHRCYPPLAGRKLAFEWLCGSLVYLPVTLNFTHVLSFFKAYAC